MANISVEQVLNAGIVGAGGAGFPTHVKLQAKADSVLINAAECEPLLHKDKELLRCFTSPTIEGLAQAMRLVGAETGIIGIKEKYTEVIEILRGSLPSNMRVAPLRDAYPAGDEFILVYDVLGRIIPPGGIPLAVGAVVMNVETVMNIAVADTVPVTEKYLTIAGDVPEPVTLRVPVGITMRECVEAAGGPTIADANYVVGGAMMGYIEDDHDALVTKTTGGIIVLPDDHVVVRFKRRDWKQIAKIGRSACDQCTFCTELCPRYLLGHPIEPHKAMRSLGFNQIGEANVIGTSFCCECNLCSYYSCPEDLDPRNVCVENKRRLMQEKRRWENPPFNQARPKLHMENRKAPMKRLMQKLDLRRYRNVGPLNETLLETNRVGIALSQHIGAPCEPVVSAGQAVKKGDVVGRRPEKDGKPALGAPVHASMDGVVASVDSKTVWIERR